MDGPDGGTTDGRRGAGGSGGPERRASDRSSPDRGPDEHLTDSGDPAGNGGRDPGPGERAGGDGHSARRRTGSRRALLRAGGVAGAVALAGCLGGLTGEEDAGPVTMADFRGSGPFVGTRPEITAPGMADLPPLSGELQVYLGGGEGGLYTQLLELFERRYDDFTAEVRFGGEAELANTIIEEMAGGGSPADVFWSVDAGSLGVVAEAGHTLALPREITERVPPAFRPGRSWVGTAGRARAIPYNTNQLSADEIPSTVNVLPDRPAVASAMGWAPAYGAFQSFVTAMRLLRGEAATKRWLRAMLDHGVSDWANEFLVSNAVAQGELAAGFANHYYAIRVTADRPNAPIELAFTSGDAGALINTAGAAVVAGTEREQLARRFVRHLLSAEAQEFFATRTYAYPMVTDVPPVGGLPTIDELDPPDVPLRDLADVKPTLALMREVGLL